MPQAKLSKCRDPVNVIHALDALQRGDSRCNYRTCLRVMSSLVIQKSSKFTRTWSKKHRGASKIIIEADNLMEKKGVIGHNLDKLEGSKGPIKAWDLRHESYKSHLPSPEIEDYITFSFPLTRIVDCPFSYGNLMMGITKFNRLFGMNTDTGKLVFSELLIDKEVCPFRTISFETLGEMILLASKRDPFKTSQGYPNDPAKTFKIFALFTMNPFRFNAMFQATEEAFGSGLADFKIGDKMIVTCVGSNVRLYSLRDLLEDPANHVAPDEPFTLNGKNLDLDESPRLLRRLTHQVRRAPPLLFDIKAGPPPIASFGGTFFQFVVHAKIGDKDTRIIRDVIGKQLAKNGEIKLPGIEFEEKVEFVNLEPQRILRWTKDGVQLYHLRPFSLSHNPERPELNLHYEMRLNSQTEANGEPVIYQTRSGRNTSKRINFTDNEDRVLWYDFEDELRMSCILGFHQDGQVWKNNAKIVIYDDETGKMVKSVDLDIDIAADDEVEDFVWDRNRIALILKRKGSYHCHVFRLTRDIDDEHIVPLEILPR